MFQAIVAAVSVVLLVVTADAQSILYGTTGGPSDPGNLYTINPATGFATLVGPLVDASNNHYAVTGLAFGSNGVLYGSTSANSPTLPGELLTINTITGRVSTVGTFGFATMADLTFDSANSTLYGTAAFSADLYSINPGTGAATVVGASGIPTAGLAGIGLAANASGTVFGTPNAASGNLYTYNVSTGAATAGPALTGAPFGTNGSIDALAFDSSSILFGVDLNRTDNVTPRASDLITINTVTGAVTNIGTIMDGSGNISYFDAIVFSVPESSTWLAGTLSLGMIVFAFIRRLPPRPVSGRDTEARS
jgi:uncharacterized repeat protein (TIGR03803 family)